MKRQSNALSTQYLVQGTQYLLLAGVITLAGCTGADSAQVSDDTPGELSLEAQVSAVENGETTRIQLEATPISGNDLPWLLGVEPLTELLLDDPRSEILGGWVLVRLPNLTHLRYRGKGIDDFALGSLAHGSPKLEILNIPRGDFTDAGLGELKQLPGLIQLRFGSPRVTDAGMKTLAELPALKRLHLIDVPITDAGLAELAKIEGLESLYIDGGSISDEAWDKLFRERPKLHVHVNQQHHDRDPHAHAH
jgi:hypothetical protein